MFIKGIKSGIAIINGTAYTANSVHINNGEVIVDGEVAGGIGTQKITVNIEGDVESIETGSGDVSVNGSVRDIETGSGDVECRVVNGNIRTGSGDVSCTEVRGNIKTSSGDVDRRLL